MPSFPVIERAGGHSSTNWEGGPATGGGRVGVAAGSKAVHAAALELLAAADPEAEGRSMILHHLSLGSNDLDRSRAFYDPVLAVLGLRRLNADAQSLDYGAATWFFSLERPLNGQPATPGNGCHIAFAAENRAMGTRLPRHGSRPWRAGCRRARPAPAL